jgi:glycolate oxidase iron-sulfur subunit
LRTRKLENIRRTRPDVVAAGNIGCITQLAGDDLPVVHTVELLDWMAGGPVPGGIARLVEQRGLAAEAEAA